MILLIRMGMFLGHSKLKSQSGFSLIEMAIVLVILGMLLAGLITPLSTQREVSQRQATERQLQQIRNALIGFAQANGRLPCPALQNGNGVEDRTGTTCNTPNGFLPFQGLGLEGTLFNGNIVDAWQQPIRYRVSRASGAWTFALDLTPIPAAADFRVCSVRTCLLNERIATDVAAVVFSTGPDGANIPASPDQLENQDIDDDFVMRPKTGEDRTGYEFDDILVWISRPALVYELSRAGQ